MDLSYIIVNYRTEGLLKQCLRGIALAAPKGLKTETIVVENGSGDGSAAMVRANFPEATLLVSERNGGFAYGVNRGMEAARGAFRFILNPDLALFPGVPDAMVSYLRAHPAVGMVAPRLLNPDGTVQLSARRFPTPLTPLYSRTPLGGFPPFKGSLRNYLMAEWDHRDIRPVDWVLGAAMVVRAKAALEVGPMDERYFLYFEDVDWCRRFWEHGWAVEYLANVELVHYHQRLSAARGFLGSLFDRTTRIHIASAARYFSKFGTRRVPVVKSAHAV